MNIYPFKKFTKNLERNVVIFISLWKIIDMKYLFVIAINCAFVLNSFGWGQTGHRIIGQIAENHLSKKIRKQITEILDGHSIAMVSNFMDEIKSEPK